MGNGSTELTFWIDVLLTGNRIATPIPTFGPWIDHPVSNGKEVCCWRLLPESGFELDMAAFVEFVHERNADTVVLCQPNNPTGTLADPSAVIDLMDALSEIQLIVVDESFIDFASEDGIPSVVSEAARRSNVVVLKSLGKNCGLHGVRAGYAVASRELAQRLRQALPAWNINALAETLIRAFADHQADYESARRRAVSDRRYLEHQLRTLSDLVVVPSQANFVYVRIPASMDGIALRNWLLCEYGYLVRECGNKLGSDSSYFRIASRPADEVDALIDVLRLALENCRHE